MDVAGHKHSDCINREIALFTFLFFSKNIHVRQASSSPQPMGQSED